MSNSTPQLVPQTARLRRARLWPLFWLIPIGILAGVLSGALISGLYAWLGPSYQWAIHQRVQSFYLFGAYFIRCLGLIPRSLLRICRLRAEAI